MISIKDGYKILFLGDSITDFKFNRLQNAKIGGCNIYALQVAKQLKKKHKSLKFFYKGIASNRSYHVYDRLTKDCINLKPDVIVMLIGVNDAWENYVPEKYPPLVRPFEPHIKEIYRRIKMELPNTKVVTMLPFLIDTIDEKKPFHKVLDEFRTKLVEYATPTSDEIIDLQKMFYQAQTKYSPYDLSKDGVHPTNFGHGLIASELLNVLD